MKKSLTLEQQANVLLYGTPNIIEAAEERQIFTILGQRTAIKRTLTVYAAPKMDFYTKKYLDKCVDCGRLRNAGGAARCRECYRKRAHDRFAERSPHIEHYMDLLGSACLQYGSGDEGERELTFTTQAD